MQLYTFYILQLQTWCSKTPYIHGLWPQTTSTTYPSNCQSNETFNLDIHSSLFADLNRTWFDCNVESSMKLWAHEYNKHLTCVANQTGMNQNEIFTKIINLYDNYSGPSDRACYDLQWNTISCYKSIDQ